MEDRFYSRLVAVTLSMSMVMLVVLIDATLLTEETLPSALVEIPEPPTPAPLQSPFVAPQGSRFAFHYVSQHFVLWTNVKGVDLHRLSQVAEDTRVASFKCLDIDPVPWRAQLPVFLCRNAEEIALAGAHLGHDLPPGPRSAGGYYVQGPLIAVVDTGERRELTVSHEVVHAVIGPLFRRCPSVLHEGLAMLVSERLLSGTESLKAYWNRHRNWRARWIRRTRDKGELPSLRALMQLGYWRFHGKGERLNYYLSWCLAEVLVDSPDAQLFAVLKACDAQWDPWFALSRVHTRSVIEGRWLEQIDRVAATAK